MLYPFVMNQAANADNASGQRVESPVDNPLQCCYCGKIFTRIYYRREHERIHTGEKPFSCSICGKKFNSNGSCKKHEKIHLRVEESVSMECSHCGKMFDDMQDFRQHMKTHDGAKPYSCNICGRSFGFEAVLKKHLMFHNGQKPFQCLVCSAAYSTANDLRMHVKTHTGDKPYKCRYCNLRFPNSRRRNMHERCHEKSNEHKCNRCGATFNGANALATHEANSSIHGVCQSVEIDQDAGYDDQMSESSTSTHSVPGSSGFDRSVMSEVDIGLLGKEYERPNSSESHDSGFPTTNYNGTNEAVYPTSLLHATENGIVVKQEQLDGERVEFSAGSVGSDPDTSSFSPKSHRMSVESDRMSNHDYSGQLTVVAKDSKQVQTEQGPYTDSLLSQLESLKQIHECKNCGILFRNYSMFLVHKTLHADPVRPFVCHLCGEESRDAVDFNAHLIWHMK
ncbi:zinc finger protein 658B-like isoform X1 [Saccostrea cucullata]|uniref:zinc finger protein 658B-like isoform X1 n=2 Tax=Saccostrea cuccullata TaxID=36930 RepID=UPI002ED26F89